MSAGDIGIDELSFTGYRLKNERGGYEAQEYALTLGHWFEAQKFRSFARDIYRDILLMPSLKEAHKLGTRNLSCMRSDWLAVQEKALACGMLFAAQADGASTRWQGSAAQICAILRPLKLKARLVELAANEFLAMRDAQRIIFLGGSRAGSDIAGRRVYLVNKAHKGYFRLAHWQGRHASWPVHDWCVMNYIPVTYFGAEGESFSMKEVASMREHCESAVVFEDRTQKHMEPIIKNLKAQKIPVSVDLSDNDSAAQVTSDLFAE